MRSIKILTSSKAHLIDKLLGGATRAESPPSDYFYLGAPILSPPRIRGSMLVLFDESFIHENASHFQFGSPIDLGALRFGFFTAPSDISQFESLCVCDYEKFASVAAAITGLPDRSRIALANHQLDGIAASVLGRFFHPSVIEFMCSNTNDPHACLFEFALGGGYEIGHHHVLGIAIPNTFGASDDLSSLAARFVRTLITFNPKYGVEEAWRNLAETI